MKLRHTLNLALKQVMRHRVRSLLTVAGVGAGMFLFTAVQTMQHSLSRVIQSSANDNVLVVYRENRFCPMTSRLPEHYLSEIEGIDGVTEAIPIQIAVNNCGASLDVITFRGVPPETLSGYNPELEVTGGSMQEWKSRSDAALIGEHLARRRGLSPGDTFEAVGVRVLVAGIVRSPLQQDNNVAYVHLPLLTASLPRWPRNGDTVQRAGLSILHKSIQSQLQSTSYSPPTVHPPQLARKKPSFSRLPAT